MRILRFRIRLRNPNIRTYLEVVVRYLARDGGTVPERLLLAGGRHHGGQVREAGHIA
jgi:hypothetical protein